MPCCCGRLRARAAALGLEIETVCADARSFDLERRDFALCIVPMQTVQLLGGAAGRVAFLRAAREHLREGATIACAILTDVEPFDCAQGSAGPAAERAHVDGRLFLSRAVRVSELADGVEIERERRVIDERPGTRGGAAQPPPERNVIKLDRVDAARAGARGARGRPARAGAPRGGGDRRARRQRRGGARCLTRAPARRRGTRCACARCIPT